MQIMPLSNPQGHLTATTMQPGHIPQPERSEAPAYSRPPTSHGSLRPGLRTRL